MENQKVFISTYGCQMNVNDTERMYSLLEMADFVPVENPEDADVIIINSCSVREKPVHKVYSEVGTFKKLKKKKPHLKIGVGGCVGQQEKGNLTKEAPLVDFVFGTDSIDDLPRLVLQAFSKEEPEKNRREEVVERRQASEKKTWLPGAGSVDLEDFGNPGSAPLPAALANWKSTPLPVVSTHGNKIIHTPMNHRAEYQIETLIRNPGISTFVNITKGCDNFCTFCVVPYTRGRERSRTLQEIVKDIKKLQVRGVKEVTLLGQNVNSYRSSCGADFADLLSSLVENTDLIRIRFTTSHPKDFNEKLVKVMSSGFPRICEYIHLPFQSGSSRILQLMNRGYSREQYKEKIQMIRQWLPQVVFSSDVIVGFPSETDADFYDTLSLIEWVGYETLFAFKYSPRPFTKASRMGNQIEEEVKAQRLEQLFQFHNQLAHQYAKKYEGKQVQALVETYDEKKGILTGRSGQNKSVFFPGRPELIGQVVDVVVEKAFPSVLRGHLTHMLTKE